MKKLILLPFLVFGQFLAHAQKPAKKATQVITMNLLVAGSVHLPKTNNGKANGKDKNQTAQDKVVLTQSQDVVINTQVIEAVSDDKSNSGKKSTVLTTVSSL